MDSYFDSLMYTDTEIPYADPYAIDDAAYESAGSSIDDSPSFLQTLWGGVQDASGALVAGISATSSNKMVQNAIDAAKSSVLANTVAKLSARSDVQASVKTATGNQIGAFFMSYWKELAIGALLLFWFVARKK